MEQYFMSKNSGTKLVNPNKIKQLHVKLKNALITKEWDLFDTALAIDSMQELIVSYEIMFQRYFHLMNLDVTDLDKMKDLYFIDETEAQMLFVDEEKH